MNLKNGPHALLGLICIVSSVGLLLIGLWPFDFRPENEAGWLKEGNGLHFYGHGLIHSKGPLDISARTGPSINGVSMEIWLKAETEPDSGVPNIVTFYSPQINDNVMIGQWKSHLIIRSGNIYSGDRRRFRELGLADALDADEISFITITSDEEGTSLYAEGEPAEQAPGYRLFDAGTGRAGSGLLVLGSSPAGRPSWRGTIYGLSVYNRRLSDREVREHYRMWMRGDMRAVLEREPAALYTFEQGEGRLIYDRSGQNHPLHIPPTFDPLRKTVLAPSWNSLRLRYSSLFDLVINVVGFVPFGVFLSAFFGLNGRLTGGRLVLVAVVFGGAVSLTIELVQVLLPFRDSSLIDLLCNLLGTTVGAFLLVRFLHSSRTRAST